MEISLIHSISRKEGPEMRKEYKSKHVGYKIRITYPPGRDSDFTLQAYALDENSYRVDKCKRIRRKVKHAEALDTTIIFAKNAIETQLDKILRVEKPREEKKPHLDTAMRKAFDAVLRLGSFYLPWGEAYSRNVLTYSRRNIIPWCDDNNVEERFTAVEKIDLQQYLAEKIMSHGKFKGSCEDALIGAAIHMNAFDQLYQLMRSIDPSLPDVSFGIKLKTSRAKVEQTKMLSITCHRKFRFNVCKNIKSKPKHARGAALMDNGLRSGEASAITKDLMRQVGDIIVVWVLYQEYLGDKSDVLKTEDSYRLVVLDEWGSMVVKRCNQLITEEDTVYTKKAPIIDTVLSAWVKELLYASGVEEELFIEAHNSELKHLRYDSEGKPILDAAAHILRRNRASIQCNICGFSAIEREVFIGHKKKANRYSYDNPKWDTTIYRIAVKNSLYDLNTEISSNPIHRPIELTKGKKGEVFPFPKYRFRNNSNNYLELKIDMLSCEPGEAMSITGARNLKINLNARSKSSQGKRRNENLIGGINHEI